VLCGSPAGDQRLPYVGIGSSRELAPTVRPRLRNSSSP
jgi:hypothetical protein